MKKVMLFFTLILTSLSAPALNVKVECLTPVNAGTQNEVFEAKILKDAKFESGFEFKKYTTMYFDIIETIPSKWGKRSAYMVIKPIAVTDAENWKMPLEETDIEGKTKTLKILKKPDLKKELKENAKSAVKSAAGSAATKTANMLLPGSAQVYQLSKGLLLPEEGKTRLQSAAGNLVDNSALKHFKPGEDLNIEEGNIIVLDFYHSDIPKRKFRKRRK